MDEKVVDYIVDIVRATRDPGGVGLGELEPLIEFGGIAARDDRAGAGVAGPRLPARPRLVTPEDVKALAPDVLRHRIVLTYEAEAEDVTATSVVTKVLGALRVP